MATKKATTKKKTSKRTTRKKAPEKKDGLPPAGKEEHAIVRRLREKRGVEAVVFGGQVSSEVKEVVPTGIYVVDNHVIGIGGLPVGRVIELAAEEGGGKTSIAMSAIGMCQAEGGLAAYIDGEQSVSRERFETFGADFDRCLFTNPTTLEEAMDDTRDILELINPKRGPNLIVIDSIASVPPKRLVDGEDLKPGEVAAIITRRMKPMLKLLGEKRVALLCINQVRENINAGPFKPDTYTPGGRFFKHAASLRLHIAGGKKVESRDEDHIGKDVTIWAPKNRMHSPFRKARVRLMYETGWDDEWSTIMLAKARDLVPKGAKFNQKNYELAKAELEAAEAGE